MCKYGQYIRVYKPCDEKYHHHHTCQTSKALLEKQQIFLQQICLYYLDLILAQQDLCEKRPNSSYNASDL